MNGVCSVFLEDGLSFVVEEGMRIVGFYGYFKWVELGDGVIRMFYLVVGGIGFLWSEDGFQFALEDGLWILNDDVGLDKLGGVSVIVFFGGGY